MRFLLIGPLLTLAAMPVSAGHATFSKDGRHVYAIEFETVHLFDIDLQKNSVSSIDLGPSIENKSIISVTTAKSGDVLVATSDAAWSCQPTTGTCRKLCSAPEGTQFRAIANNPKTDDILFSARTDFDHPRQPQDETQFPVFLLASSDGEAKPVFARRVDSLDGITFSSDGQLFFGSKGDLWGGSVDAEHWDEDRPLALNAVRCAPLATFETNSGTTVQRGVFQVAVAKDKIYVHLHRMFGTGYGTVVRLPRPDRALLGKLPALEEEDHISERFRLYSKETGATEILVQNGTASYLCASPDGTRVFFTNGVLHLPAVAWQYEETKAYLVENNGKPREIKLKFAQ